VSSAPWAIESTPPNSSTISARFRGASRDLEAGAVWGAQT
jgi:hypothetical protein